MPHPSFVDLTGKRFGKLVVLERVMQTVIAKDASIVIRTVFKRQPRTLKSIPAFLTTALNHCFHAVSLVVTQKEFVHIDNHRFNSRVFVEELSPHHA